MPRLDVILGGVVFFIMVFVMGFCSGILAHFGLKAIGLM